jgi:hypothetical protein
VWPSGNLPLEVITTTAADGTAHVQWKLGEEKGLPVQRVMAYLRDDTGQRTEQKTLFIAHLAIAQEIRWDPCPYLKGGLGGEENYQVQAALDALCSALQQTAQMQVWLAAQVLALGKPSSGGSGGIVLPSGHLVDAKWLEDFSAHLNVTTFPPPGTERGLRELLGVLSPVPAGGLVGEIRVRAPGGAPTPLDPESELPLDNLTAGLEITLPAAAGAGPAASAGAEEVVRVTVEMPRGPLSGPAVPVAGTLTETTTPQGTRLVWTPTPEAVAQLRRSLRPGAPLNANVTISPAGAETIRRSFRLAR